MRAARTRGAGVKGAAGRLAIAACLVAPAACQTPLDVAAPAGFDLSGVWVLDAGASDAAPDPKAIRRREDRDVALGRQTNAEASSAFVAQDFPVVSARRMTIEQDARSMGIDYDNGAYRDVSWGERERDYWRVQAGWQDGALIIRSRRDLTEGVETMRLQGAGRLRVDVLVKTGGRDVEVTRVFERRGTLPR